MMENYCLDARDCFRANGDPTVISQWSFYFCSELMLERKKHYSTSLLLRVLLFISLLYALCGVWDKIKE
jgi:hypothetical protein